ncbi:MAG TPA: hypothetical protein P5119_11625 [Candidatus Aminicenantes bacterium]|nr:hypothetical protein [Candidatus Aminicenantes bacterium]HRY65972.1 hypothetical protein [Candidatus Aminicenantes bacterium]HRZ72979.1 hypothetical protein [Candidatus Aminicenantes bacterium]
MNRQVLKPILAAVAAAALSAACIMLPAPEGDDAGWRTTPDEEEAASLGPEFRQTVEFAPGGAVSLENDYGDVAFSGWDRDAVEVVALAEKGPAGGTRGSFRTGGSRTSRPDVELRRTDAGLLVRSSTFEGPGRPPAVSFGVRVPASVDLTGIRISEGDLVVADVYGRLEASVDEGRLSVSNFSGSVRGTVGTGDADVEVLDFRDGDEISLSVRRGDIVLRLEASVNAIVEADAPHGQVESDFPLGRKLPAAAVKGWIGQGGPNILLRAAEGRIRIVRIVDSAASARASVSAGR